MSRHQASRRRAYGRRQHELHERHQRDSVWLDEPGPGTGSGGRELDEREKFHGLQLGDLFGRQGWRWAGDRG